MDPDSRSDPVLVFHMAVTAVLSVGVLSPLSSAPFAVSLRRAAASPAAVSDLFVFGVLTVIDFISFYNVIFLCALMVYCLIAH